jgi:collagenase-like protein with putative collagen-binding domain
LNDLPNVIWSTSEEADAGSLWWNEHMMAVVREYEATKPLQHPVGFGMLTGGADSQLYSSSADWIAPNGFPVATDNHGKVVFCDGDHMGLSGGAGMGPPPGDRSFVWKSLCLGSQALMMDSYRAFGTSNRCSNPVNDLCTANQPASSEWDSLRDQLGYARIYASKCYDLAAMSPQPSKSSTGFALVSELTDATEYLVYAPTGGPFSVDLSAAGAPVSVEWFNPEIGEVTALDEPVAPGSIAQTFTPPFQGDAVLYLYKKTAPSS